MQITKITIKRNVKINTGNYENTDVGIELEAQLVEGDSVSQTALTLLNAADEIIKDKVDDIELGQRKEKSKAGRYGLR